MHESDINAKLSSINEDLIYKELRLVKILKEYNEKIQDCSNSLKTGNVCKELSIYLDDLSTMVEQQAQINNYEPYVNISTCGDINYKIIMLDFEQKKSYGIISEVSKNLSAIQQQINSISQQYSSSLTALGGFGSENQQKVFAIIRQLSKISGEFNSYISLQASTIGKLNSFVTQLTVFKRRYCTCLNHVAWYGFNTTLESNVHVIQNRLTRIQSQIQLQSNETNSALKKVNSPTISGPLSIALQGLQTTLIKLTSASDYSKVSLPNVQNCNDMSLRISFLMSKRWQYTTILITANQNLALFKMNHNQASSLMKSSKLNSNQMSLIKNFLSNVTTILSLQSSYASQLVYSIVKMSKMIADFNAYGDTHCTCEFDYATTTTSTAVSTSTTTTTTKSGTSTTLANPTTVTTDKTTTIPETLTTETISTTSTTFSTTTVAPVTTSLANPTTSTTLASDPTTTTVPTTTTLAPIETTTVKTTTTTLGPCGTFVKYDPINGRTDPEKYGVPSGIRPKDGSITYVGYGSGSACITWSMAQCLGYVSTVNGSAGSYCTCRDPAKENFDSKSAYYLQWHPNLIWVNTTIENMNSVNNAFKVTSGDCNMKVSRIFVNNQMLSSRAHYVSLFLVYFDAQGYQEKRGAIKIQVLACK